MIAIIDYDAGNIKSVEKAIQFLGEEAVITRDRDVIMASSKVILPGVGSFGDAMGKINEYGLKNVIYDVVDAEKPFLGICLGLQLLFKTSEESPGGNRTGDCRRTDSSYPGCAGIKDSADWMEFTGYQSESKVVSKPSGASICLFCSFVLFAGRA